jgi:hypothetical protein
MKIIESTIITKEEQIQKEKENALKTNNKLIQDLSKNINQSNIKIDKLTQDSITTQQVVETLSEVSKTTLINNVEHNKKSQELLSDEIRNTSKIDATLDNKLTSVENSLLELKKEYGELSEKQVNAVKQNNVAEELASIDEKVTDMVELLKKIKDKKQTTTVVGGGGGGSSWPAVNADGNAAPLTVDATGAVKTSPFAPNANITTDLSTPGTIIETDGTRTLTTVITSTEITETWS